MGFIQGAISFFSTPTHSRTMGVLTMLILVSAVFLTVTISQQQQTITQRAADTASTCYSAYGGSCYINSPRCPDGLMQKGIDGAYCPTNPGPQKCCVTSTVGAGDYVSCPDNQTLCNATTVEGACSLGETKCLSANDFSTADTYNGKSLVCCRPK